MTTKFFHLSFVSILLLVAVNSCSSINLRDTRPLPKQLIYTKTITFPFHPHKIIFDDFSNAFFLLSQSENIIYKTNFSGKLIQTIGKRGFGDGQFINLVDIDSDVFGNIYALDNDINKLIKFDENGQFVNSISFSEISEPELLNVKNNGELLVYDSATNQIFAYNSEVNLRFAFGKFELDSPSKISSTIDLNYVLDSKGKEIIIFDNFGGYVKSVSTKSLIRDISATKFFLVTLNSKNILHIIKGDKPLDQPIHSKSQPNYHKNFTQLLLFKNKIGLLDNNKFHIFQFSHK